MITVDGNGLIPGSGETRMFDAYLTVDWSASSRPKGGKDSIWYCLVEGGEVSALANPRTRDQAAAEIEALLVRLVEAGRSVLVGFDFPYAYPEGLCHALGICSEQGQAWRDIWREWRRLVTDDASNRNNRFQVAALLNERLRPGPFWGCPVSATGPYLSMKRPSRRDYTERRLTERYARTAQPVWKLYGTGSVGSQALVGIPRLEYLVSRPALASVSRVWPFQWDEEMKDDLRRRELLVLHAEIYPSLIPAEPEAGEVKDAAQVRGLAQHFAWKDAGGELAGLLDVPLYLSKEQRSLVMNEEGWILGVQTT